MIIPFVLMLSACGGIKETPPAYVLTPPAIRVTITRENCPSIEAQVGTSAEWINGDMVSLPLRIERHDESGITDIGQSEIGPGDQFSMYFYEAGEYRFFCSENQDVFGTITVK
jgi:plastocyanin